MGHDRLAEINSIQAPLTSTIPIVPIFQLRCSGSGSWNIADACAEVAGGLPFHTTCDIPRPSLCGCMIPKCGCLLCLRSFGRFLEWHCVIKLHLAWRSVDPWPTVG